MDSGPASRQMYAGVVSPLQLRVAQIIGRGVPDYGKGFADAGLWLDAEAQRGRFRSHVADLLSSDPGLTVLDVGKAIERGLGRSLVSGLPLKLLAPVTDAQVQMTPDLVATECKQLARPFVRTSSRASDW